MSSGSSSESRLVLGKLFVLGRLLFWLTALFVHLTAAVVAGIIASGFGHSGQDRGARGRFSLYSTLLGDATFHNLLLACDRDLANQVRRRRCLLCRSPLHSANYPRKPRGRLCRLPPEHDWRLSLCCARHGCRKRKTPPSLRFLGRKVYLAVTFIVIGILREGATQTRMRRLTELIRVDRRTIKRWRGWWRESFTAMPFWQAARAAFMPPVDEARLRRPLASCLPPAERQARRRAKRDAEIQALGEKHKKRAVRSATRDCQTT